MVLETLRDQVLRRLALHYAAGDLRLATLEHRVQTACRATTVGELQDLAWDLPRPAVSTWHRVKTRATGLPAPATCRRISFELAPLVTVDLDEAPRTWLIGRGSDCDVVLSDSAISRRHALVSVRGGRCSLRDLGSMNGSWCNGRLVHVAVLRPGDVVTLGRVVDGVVC